MSANINYSKKHFLTQVFYLACVSFGGPQAHYLLFQKKFINQLKWLKQDVYNEVFALCQILPGPSSTQLLTLIAYKKNGAGFALLTLIVWSLPACILMGIFSFLIPHLRQHGLLNINVFAYLICFVISLILLNTITHIKQHINTKIEALFLIAMGSFLFIFYHSPWVFIIIITSSFLYHYFINHKTTVTTKHKAQNFKKRFIIIFIVVFIIAGFLSEQARINNWKYRKPFNLFENTYRFGSTVFGGGNVLSSMMYEQYVVRVKTKYINKQDAMIGMALSQATPGPVFAYATYIGGLIFNYDTLAIRLLGCIIASIGIFLPGYLISIFFYQILEYLKKYAFMPIFLKSIQFSVCSILLGSLAFLIKDNQLYQWQHYQQIIFCAYIIAITYLAYKHNTSTLVLFFISIIIGVMQTNLP